MSALRPDLAIIAANVARGARVLDIGCGDGALLARLVEQKAVRARGVEQDEANVRACVTRGLSVRQGDIEKGLADFADGSFDYVILSQTLGCLQRPLPVLGEMTRVGRFGIVSFPNAGFAARRLRALGGGGFGPVLASGQPLARAITLAQFREAAAQGNVIIQEWLHLRGARAVRFWPALLARQSLVLLKGRRS